MADCTCRSTFWISGDGVLEATDPVWNNPKRLVSTV